MWKSDNSDFLFIFVCLEAPTQICDSALVTLGEIYLTNPSSVSSSITLTTGYHLFFLILTFPPCILYLYFYLFYCVSRIMVVGFFCFVFFSFTISCCGSAWERQGVIRKAARQPMSESLLCPLTGCVTLVQWLDISVPLFSHLRNGDKTVPHRVVVKTEWNDIYKYYGVWNMVSTIMLVK